MPLILKDCMIIRDKLRDSTIWQQVELRPTDIIICSCHKSGTTLTQQIVNLIINGHDNFISIHHLSPWVENKLSLEKFDKLELIKNLSSPRIFKTHLPFTALPYSPQVKYIYLIRDPRDVGVSLYNHSCNLLFGTKPEELKIPDNFTDFWNQWIETGEPYWSVWEHINIWWNVINLPNILFIHYSNLINEKNKEIEKIANFLERELDENLQKKILHRSSLEYMKLNWQKFEPPVFKPQTFINKGTNGRWNNLLTVDQIKHYEMLIEKNLEPDCAFFVENARFKPKNLI